MLVMYAYITDCILVLSRAFNSQVGKLFLGRGGKIGELEFSQIIG